MSQAKATVEQQLYVQKERLARMSHEKFGLDRLRIGLRPGNGKHELVTQGFYANFQT